MTLTIGAEAAQNLSLCKALEILELGFAFSRSADDWGSYTRAPRSFIVVYDRDVGNRWATEIRVRNITQADAEALVWFLTRVVGYEHAEAL